MDSNAAFNSASGPSTSNMRDIESSITVTVGNRRIRSTSAAGFPPDPRNRSMNRAIIHHIRVVPALHRLLRTPKTLPPVTRLEPSHPIELGRVARREYSEVQKGFRQPFHMRRDRPSTSRPSVHSRQEPSRESRRLVRSDQFLVQCSKRQRESSSYQYQWKLRSGLAIIH